MADSVLAIANPNAGDRSGPKFLQEHVIPLLSSADIPVNYHETSSAAEAGDLIKQHISHTSTGAVVLAGGDGTVHDALNHIFLDEITSKGTSKESDAVFTIILVPTGTANAMYYSFFPPESGATPSTTGSLPSSPESDVAAKLRSVQSYIAKVQNASSKPTSRPLSIALAQTYPSRPTSDSAPPAPTRSILSCVVNSTSIHAGILHTAEKYRESIPGMERFKVAAGENIHNWALADAELLPVSGSAGVQVYDPKAKELVSYSSTPSAKLEGPFFYFLCTINVNRLEPAFVTTPLAQRTPPPNGAALDVVIVRPHRFAAHGYGEDTKETREKFVAPAMEWFGQIYNGGEHIHHQLKGGDGEEGSYVTEYFRVGGWRWFPKASDEFSRLVCVDGTVLQIPEGGYASVEVVAPEKLPAIQVWI